MAVGFRGIVNLILQRLSAPSSGPFVPQYELDFDIVRFGPSVSCLAKVRTSLTATVKIVPQQNPVTCDSRIGSTTEAITVVSSSLQGTPRVGVFAESQTNISPRMLGDNLIAPAIEQSGIRFHRLQVELVCDCKILPSISGSPHIQPSLVTDN